MTEKQGFPVIVVMVLLSAALGLRGCKGDENSMIEKQGFPVIVNQRVEELGGGRRTIVSLFSDGTIRRETRGIEAELNPDGTLTGRLINTPTIIKWEKPN